MGKFVDFFAKKVPHFFKDNAGDIGKNMGKGFQTVLHFGSLGTLGHNPWEKKPEGPTFMGMDQNTLLIVGVGLVAGVLVIRSL